MSHNDKYRILLIEPSELIAMGFKEVISRYPEFEIVNILSNLSYYIPTQQNVDVIVVNPAVVNYNERLDIRSFFAAENEGVTIIALTNSGFEERVMRQYDGCINIYDDASRIVHKMRSAIEEAKLTPRNELNELSSRERDILVAVAKGMANKEIADEFNISIYTVISHRRNISRKLGLNSVPGLTVYAIMNKLIDISDFN